MSYKEIIENFSPIDLEEMRKKGFLEENRNYFKKNFQKVEENNNWKEIKECPLCKSDKKTIEFSKFDVKIFCCNDCNLRYSEKIPNNTGDIYDEGEFLTESIDNYVKNVEYRKERFGKERVNLIKSFVKEKNAKLLDVGCGVGWFLEVAKESGFEIYGQDIGKELTEWASKRLGAKIWNKHINELNTEIKFDVITLFDVIEHVEDPLQLLNNCKKLLTKEGIIIIFTPNFDSLSIYITKEDSNLISFPEHLVYFSEKPVKILSDKLNMELVYYKTYGLDLGDLKSYYEWKGEDEIAKLYGKIYPFIQPIVDASGAANHIRFILKNN